MKNIFNDYVQTLETYIMFTIKMRTLELTPMLEKIGRKPISLSMGAPKQAPPKFVNERVVEILKHDTAHSYSTPKGEPYFLEAIAQRMKNRFNVELDPKKEIFSLIGSKEGIANLLRAICNPSTNDKEKDIILIPDPGYASYKEMLKVSGGLAYPLPLTSENNYMPNLDDVIENLKKDGFDEKKVKAVVLNYPNNPLGACCTLEYLKETVEFCKKRNILLISDAAYTDLYFDETQKPHSILEVDGAKDVAIEFFSMSKSYAMTGWRIGWVCGNSEAISFLGKLKSTIDTGVFKTLQKASAELLVSKEGDDYIKEWNKNYARKQKIVLEGFKSLGWEINEKYIPKATFYLWLPIPRRYKTALAFTNDILEKSGIVLVPGNAFGNFGEGYFRLSFVADDDELKEVFVRMKQDGFTF